MTPQETHAAVVSLLQQQGLPLTTANLNRGMLALSQNDMQSEGAALPAVNRSMDRTRGVAQQSASRPALPTPPIPPTTVPPQQQAATTLELNTPGTLPAGVRNSVEAFLADKGTQPAMPDGSASSAAATPVAAPTAAPTTPSTNASTRTAATASTPASTSAATPRGPILNTVGQGVSAAQDYLSKLMADPASIVQSLQTPATARVNARNAQLGTRNTQMQQLEQYAQDNAAPSPAPTPTPAAVGNADMRPSTPLYDMTTGNVELPGDSPLTPTAPSVRSPTNLVDAMRQQSQQRIADQIAAMTGGNTMLPGNTDAIRVEGMTIPTLPKPATPFSLETIGEDIRNGRVPNPNPNLPLILFGTGPVPRATSPALQQFMRQRVTDIMKQNGSRPSRPPSQMVNPNGEGFEEALAARAAAGQRSTYRGEGVDNFIQGGNVQTPATSTPASSMKTNTPTWKGESDPSAPMGARSTAVPQTTQSNTATPRSGGSADTSGAGAAIKQSMIAQKQRAASKSTREKND